MSEKGQKGEVRASRREDSTGLGRACVISGDMGSSVTCLPPTSCHLLLGAWEQRTREEIGREEGWRDG